MSTEGETSSIKIENSNQSAEPKTADRFWKSVDHMLDRAGEYFNPILVKETRQALKSRQFLITFGLLLLLGWAWSILGIATIGPGASFGAYGGQMFLGYFVILAFPLMVVVPFGTFRSLAAEQESRTYELLSITALGPRQIVAGKLGSAILQMSVYLSAVSPCLAFTYLLRGIDFLTIFLILFWICMASLGCAAIGLLLATMTPRKQFQVIPMVAAVLAFFMCFGWAIGGAVTFFEEGGTTLYSEWEFWVVNAAILTVFAAYFVMVCEASASRLSFTSDNHSSRLRAIMVLHYLLLIGWLAAIWMLNTHGPFIDPELFLVFMLLAGIHWYIMGAFMVGESPKLSARVKRQLPRSFLTRMFLTWFYPGPGTGYALALCGLFSTLLIVSIAIIINKFNLGSSSGRWSGNTYQGYIETAYIFGVIGLSYVTIYLGLGLLLIRALRRVASAGLMLSILLQIFLLLLGCLVPLVIQLSSTARNSGNYTLLQITNPFWTLIEVFDRPGVPKAATPYLLIFVPLTALVVFSLNLPGLIREIRNIRIIKPQRVIEDDAEMSADTADTADKNHGELN